VADQIELELDFDNPYKASRLFVKSGRAFFGIWNPPIVQYNGPEVVSPRSNIVIPIDGDEERVTVVQGMEGQLDLYADAIYGRRSLWRVIAQANFIDLPLRDVKVGMTLIIPKPTYVNAALLATSTRQGAAT
jgi:hypothetical protein